LIYNIQTKPHFAEDDWTTVSSASIFPSEVPTDGSGFTVASFRAYYSGGDQIDFRVQALLEYEHTVYEFTRLLSPGSDFGYYPVGNATDIYETSEWSPTQTFIMPNTSNPTHILFSLDTLLTITMVISIVALLVAVISVLLYRKHRRINKIGDREKLLIRKADHIQDASPAYFFGL
jgi:hypothetical protein